MKVRGESRRERMERESASSLSASEAQAIVRRFGFVLMKVHEVLVSRAIADDKQQLAELLNDMLKPIADLLVHFEVTE